MYDNGLTHYGDRIEAVAKHLWAERWNVAWDDVNSPEDWAKRKEYLKKAQRITALVMPETTYPIEHKDLRRLDDFITYQIQSVMRDGHFEMVFPHFVNENERLAYLRMLRDSTLGPTIYSRPRDEEYHWNVSNDTED